MNYIQEQFEKRTGRSCQTPGGKYELTIFRKGVESGRAFERPRIEELEKEKQELKKELSKYVPFGEGISDTEDKAWKNL